MVKPFNKDDLFQSKETFKDYLERVDKLPKEEMLKVAIALRNNLTKVIRLLRKLIKESD